MFPVTTKKTKVKAVLAINKAAKAFYTLYITNKMECFSFKNRCVVWVVKHLKEGWLI